ncbi:proline-rich extensin EPR1 [Labeo rohita]|uniref:Proline-rich extensin EPR1 n=1 Tax=Labeo rohita TaxID=84645 RepID=A0A498N7P1_LABRO|nr:proline-rich extensin EPR1 [Labeo rohita]
MHGQGSHLIKGTRRQNLEHRLAAFSFGKIKLQKHMVVVVGVSVFSRTSILTVKPMTTHTNQMIQRDTFVLPLLWWGLPVKVSCSSLTSVKSAPTVSCYTNGMIVRLHRGVSENLKIKVMNEWQPLLKVSARCGYSLVSHPEGLVIHAPYMPCTEPKVLENLDLLLPPQQAFLKSRTGFITPKPNQDHLNCMLHQNQSLIHLHLPLQERQGHSSSAIRGTNPSRRLVQK